MQGSEKLACVQLFPITPQRETLNRRIVILIMPGNYDVKRGDLTCERNRSDISQAVSQYMGVGG